MKEIAFSYTILISHRIRYVDGHERSNVVEFRNYFVSKIKEPEPLCHTPVVCEGQRPIIVVYHDESTVYSKIMLISLIFRAKVK